MSRVPGSFQLGRFTAACASDGRALVPGEPIVATLCDAPAGDESGHEFVRRDFAVEAWKAAITSSSSSLSSLASAPALALTDFFTISGDRPTLKNDSVPQTGRNN
jgi:hypothetical protein